MMRVQCWLRTWVRGEAEGGGGGSRVTDKRAEAQTRSLTFGQWRGGLALNEETERGGFGGRDERRELMKSAWMQYCSR